MRSEPSDRVAMERSTQEVMWQRKGRPIVRRIVTLDLHLRRGYVAQRDWLTNRFIDDLIRPVDLRSYNRLKTYLMRMIAILR